jgi:hypothetical protein
VTTPGGVPNLPPGALTLDTLASETQDMSTPAMKARAAGRFSSIFSSSTGLSPASDITPFGILTGIFSGFNSTVANADPADIDGPEDLPGLLIDFIESLPVVGQFVQLLEALLGDYSGDDPTLLAIRGLFAPIRAVVDAVTAAVGGGDLGAFFEMPFDLINGLLTGGQGVNVLSLFGDLPTELIGLIAPSSIGTSNPNLLINPGFDGSVSLSDTGAHFVYDAAVGRTSPGAARTTCNGVTHSLFSNPIKVTAGQKIHFETYVQWSGVSATGSPFQVQVAKYLDGSLVGYQTIGSVGGAGSGSWTKCTGTDYTVPSSGVDTVRMKLTCASTATAGSGVVRRLRDVEVRQRAVRRDPATVRPVGAD